ncbi:MAG: hypothetical protein LQ346_007701 [Caloplaca aetnensis]|nr:MAG: hypothetical protein LQ346_007701 [Caloplaca aetnensis]
MSSTTPPDVHGPKPSTAKEYYTLLKIAVQQGNLDLVKSTLSNWRADISMADPGPDQINYLVAQAATGNGHPETLDYLLSELGGKIGTHAISLARSPAIFKVFIAHGLEVDGSILRSHVHDPELVALFLSHGADANGSGSGGLTPLDVAAMHGSLETAKMLVDHGAKIEAGSAALHAAAKGDAPDRIPVMEFLIEIGADVNGLAADLTGPSEARRSSRKGTPLHSATKWANEEAKTWLLEHGADPGARNELGETPEEWGKRFDNDGPERIVRLRRAILRKQKAEI